MLKEIQWLINKEMEGMAYWDIDDFTLPFFTNQAEEDGTIRIYPWMQEMRGDILSAFYFPIHVEEGPPFYHSWIERCINKENVFPEIFWREGILTSFNGVIENEDENIAFIDEKGNVYFRDEETAYYQKNVDFRDEEITIQED